MRWRPAAAGRRRAPRVCARPARRARPTAGRRWRCFYVGPPIARVSSSRHLDIFASRQHRQQVVELKHEAHAGVSAFISQPRLAQAIEARRPNHDAALGGRIQTPDEIQQSRFPRAGGPHESDEAALVDVEVDVTQHLDLLPAPLVGFAHIADRDQVTQDAPFDSEIRACCSSDHHAAGVLIQLPVMSRRRMFVSDA